MHYFLLLLIGGYIIGVIVMGIGFVGMFFCPQDRAGEIEATSWSPYSPKRGKYRPHMNEN